MGVLFVQHITSLKLTLEASDLSKMSSSQISSMGPYLQGVLMEQIDGSYADLLHQLAFNPYSQYCCRDEGSGALIWSINALTDDAADRIIAPLSKISSVSVKSAGITFEVTRRSSETVSLKSLLNTLSDTEKTLMNP